MARHPTARRTHRPQPAADDIFVERVLETTVWARRNRRLLVGGAIAAAILIAGVLYYRHYNRVLRESAAMELLQVRQSAQSGNPALAIRDGEAFLARFGRTPSAPEGRLLLGQAYLESNQATEAIETLQGAAGNLNDANGVDSAFLLAAAYEVATRYDEAERTYLRIAERARFDFQKERALDSAARVRMERGNPAGAAELYDRLVALLPAENPDRAVFEMRRAEARAAASTRPGG
jgi:predicted negative regulator of RcsB-dependent stress response